MDDFDLADVFPDDFVAGVRAEIQAKALSPAEREGLSAKRRRSFDKRLRKALNHKKKGLRVALQRLLLDAGPGALEAARGEEGGGDLAALAERLRAQMAALRASSAAAVVLPLVNPARKKAKQPPLATWPPAEEAPAEVAPTP